MAVTSRHAQAGELVINWHLTEACNYACRYCYSKWHTDGTGKELIRNPDAGAALLAEIYRQFAPTRRNHARLGMEWQSLRLSLAGGEPLLYGREIVRIAAQARAIGFDVSVITNGSRLTQALMAELAPQLSLLGLSLDSATPATNREIGRADRQSRVLSLAELAPVIEFGRKLNPALRLKINTVVNALNFTEDMAPLIRQLAPDKWKVLRMLPTVTSDLAIADHEFAEFVDRHAEFGNLISAEDNGDMVESYIMIDPRGRFFQNSPSGCGNRYSDAILDVGAETAFRQISWLADKFQARYAVDRNCSAKEIDGLVRELVRQGWLFRRGGKHGRLMPPTGKATLSVPSTPSDRRAFLNFRRDVRHALELCSNNPPL